MTEIAAQPSVSEVFEISQTLELALTSFTCMKLPHYSLFNIAGPLQLTLIALLGVKLA